MDRLTTAVIASAVLSLPYSAQAQSNAPTGGKLTTFPIASTPYTGQEVCYMVQGGVSKQYPCAPAGGSTIGTVTHVICGAGLGGAGEGLGGKGGRGGEGGRGGGLHAGKEVKYEGGAPAFTG